MTVIVIYEYIDGMIGIAKNYESAIDFLLQNHWFDEIMDKNCNSISIKGLNMSIDVLKQKRIYEFNEIFVDDFHLEIDVVWGM